MRTWIVVMALVWVPAASCLRADSQVKGATGRVVTVTLADTHRQLRGTLVRLDAHAVTLRLATAQVRLPLDRVIEVRARKPDSLKNGILLGALIGGALCALNCGQGLGSARQMPPAVASSAAVWGAVGAAIDAASSRDEILFRAPAAAAPQPREGEGRTVPMEQRLPRR